MKPSMHKQIKAWLTAILLCVSMLPDLAPAEDVNIAAASDLKFALEDIAQSFHQATGQVVALSFGSSGTFTTQIQNGAPFQLFLSADESYVLQLQKDGLTANEGVLYALGRIVIIAPADSALAVDSELKGLAALVSTGKLKRFAIANPEHAPYGRAAEAVLRHVGLWDAMQSQLVLGENVSQAAQFATGGSADGGIVALSLVKSPQLAGRIRYALIPSDWHAPLRQRMVLLRNAGSVAQAFYAYLQQAEARAIFTRYGFNLPGDAK
jgi:molybdate transport system substrate-binding protein